MKATGHVAALCWIAFVLFWVVSAFSVKPTKQNQSLVGRWIYLWLIVLTVLLLNGAIQGVQLDRSVLPHNLVVGVLADGIIVVGLCICIWARAVLGGNWSPMVNL